MQTKTNKISTEKASVYQNQHWKNVSIFLEDFICSFFKSSNEKINSKKTNKGGKTAFGILYTFYYVLHIPYTIYHHIIITERWKRKDN